MLEGVISPPQITSWKAFRRLESLGWGIRSRRGFPRAPAMGTQPLGIAFGGTGSVLGNPPGGHDSPIH